MIGSANGPMFQYIVPLYKEFPRGFGEHIFGRGGPVCKLILLDVLGGSDVQLEPQVSCHVTPEGV